MFSKRFFVDARRRPAWLLAALWASTSLSATDAPLNLAAAEALAMTADPVVRQFESRSRGLEERAVAAAQLPDPKLKLGANALPTDSFDLDQEPMTQIQVGYQQRFLPGDTLELRGRELAVRARVLGERAVDQRLQTLRSVREDYLEVFYQQRAGEIVAEARALFEELLMISQDYYATGRAQQQDVYRAELELSRLDDRATRIAQAEETARAGLAVWIGEAAYRPFPGVWPALPAPEPAEALVQNLENHPVLQALQQQVDASELGVDVARQGYKPGWMLDVTYGRRSGRNLDGSDRADFVSAMVTVDLPLFRARRQDRELAATLSEVEASVAARQDARRKLQRGVEREWAGLRRLEQRLTLFDQRLLPDARANSEASLAAYQSGVSDFTTLMRARITEYELRIDQARARADELTSRARLDYLSGRRS